MSRLTLVFLCQEGADHAASWVSYNISKEMPAEAGVGGRKGRDGMTTLLCPDGGKE